MVVCSTSPFFFKDKERKMKREDIRHKDVKEEVSEESMRRLSQIMNDSPTLYKLGNTEWRITALKPATQWLIAEEACKVITNEKATMGDVLKGLAINMPSVCRIITLALLNDKRKIYNPNIYHKVYDALFWGDGMKEWAGLLLEILNLSDVDFFFAITKAVAIFQRKTLARKVTMEEQKQLSLEQNGVK